MMLLAYDVAEVMLLLTYVLILVFLRRWRIFCCGVMRCYWLSCCCLGPAVVNIPSAPCVTTNVGVPSDVGVPAVTGISSVFSIHAVEWHSTVDTNGKLAAAAVVVGKFATGIDDTGGQ